MKCSQCGTSVPDSAAFCPKCGSRLRTTTFSPKPETFKFSCDVCGQHISVPKAWSGRLAVCPSCNQRVRIPRPGAVTAVPSGTPPLPPEPGLKPPPLPRVSPQPEPGLKPPPLPPIDPDGKAADFTAAIPEVPPAVLAAGKRRNLMAGIAGIGILFCLLAVLGVVGVRLFNAAAATHPADFELFRRIAVACTIYCVDSRGSFPAGEGVVGWRRLIDRKCMDRSLLLPDGTEFAERNLKTAYVGGGLQEGAVDCALLPVAFDKPRFYRGGIRVLHCNGEISVVEFPGKERTCAAFAAFLRESIPGPEGAWARILENAGAVDFADGL